MPGAVSGWEVIPNSEKETAEIWLDLLFSMMAKALENRKGKRAWGSIC